MIICINPPQAPLQTLVQQHNHNNNEPTYHTIAIRHVAANEYIQKFWKQTIALDASLCYVIITCFILPWHHKSCQLKSLIKTFRSVIFPSPQGMDYSVYPAANQSLDYNTTQALIVWARTEWSLRGFEMQCSIVWYVYDSVILDECKSFKARFVDLWSLHTSQLIWLETLYGHAGYHWESLHQSDGKKMHWDEMYMFQLTISIALNPIPESNASGPCHAMTVTIITF